MVKRDDSTGSGDGLSPAHQFNALAADNERLLGELAKDKIARKEWSEERALLMAMINQVPDYLFVKDTNSRFLMANRAVARDLGLADPEEMIGQSDFEHHSFEVAQGFAAADRAVMQSGRPKLDIEEFVIDSSGAKKWLSTSKVPLRNERNESSA
jgi:PAS domain S-box-containing protein